MRSGLCTLQPTTPHTIVVPLEGEGPGTFRCYDVGRIVRSRSWFRPSTLSPSCVLKQTRAHAAGLVSRYMAPVDSPGASVLLLPVQLIRDAGWPAAQ